MIDLLMKVFEEIYLQPNIEYTYMNEFVYINMIYIYFWVYLIISDSMIMCVAYKSILREKKNNSTHADT